MKVLKGGINMSLLGNIIWILLGGLWAALGWIFAGILCCITIVGIPFGKQCFKMAALQLAPFGKEVKDSGTDTIGLIGNILWVLFLGWELALANLISAFMFAISIIGLPFAVQSLKLVKLSFMPFGKDIVDV